MRRVGRGEVEKVVRGQIRQHLKGHPRETELYELYSKYNRKPLKQLEKE